MSTHGAGDAPTLEPIERSDTFVKCYGCGPDNPHGVKLSFGLDRAGERVVAEWTAPQHFAGYRNFTHGGVIATLLDEAMGWTLWGVARKLGMTRKLEVTYVRPVFVGKSYRVIGSFEHRDDDGAILIARILDGRDRLAAEGRGDFVFVNESKAADIVG